MEPTLNVMVGDKVDIVGPNWAKLGKDGDSGGTWACEYPYKGVYPD